MLFMVQFSTAHFYFWNIYINLLIEYLHSVRSPADHKMDDFEALMSQFEETPGPVETPGETTAPVAVENSAPPYSLKSEEEKREGQQTTTSHNAATSPVF